MMAVAMAVPVTIPVSAAVLVAVMVICKAALPFGCNVHEISQHRQCRFFVKTSSMIFCGSQVGPLKYLCRLNRIG